MKASEVRKLNDEEIAVELDRVQRRVYDLRVQAITDTVEDPSQFAKSRKDIARMMTERRSREIAAGKGRPTKAQATAAKQERIAKHEAEVLAAAEKNNANQADTATGGAE